MRQGRLVALVSSLLLVFAATGLAAPPAEGRRLALVVGVNEFEDPRWPRLRFPAKDAADVARALRRTFDRVITLREAPTRADVLAALDDLTRASTSPTDTVVVYLSTHGTLDYDVKGKLQRVLVLSDTREAQSVDTGLTHRDLLDRLERARSKRKLVVIASCHSGVGKSQLSRDLARDLRSLKSPFFEKPVPTPGEGRIVLAASAWGETAREDEGLKNDIYTHFFLQALEGFDLDNDGATTALEAHEFARRRTSEFTGGRQRPSLTAELVGDDPIVLAGKRLRTGHPMVASWAAAFSGGRLEVDGRDKGALPGSFVLKAGEHDIRVLKGDAVLLERSIDVEPGQVTLLETLAQAPSRPWLELSAGSGARGVRSRVVGRDYLPNRWTAQVRGAWISPDAAWRVGIELGASQLQHEVGLSDPLAGRVPAVAALLIFDGAATLDRRLFTWGPLEFVAGGRLGASVGRRRFEIQTVAEPTQVIGVPWGGLGLGLSWAATPVVGLHARAGVDLLMPSIEGRLRPTFSDAYLLGVWVRP